MTCTTRVAAQGLDGKMRCLRNQYAACGTASGSGRVSLQHEEAVCVFEPANMLQWLCEKRSGFATHYSNNLRS
jgi:hypothetical protein